jgi:hypothetical protein
VKNDFDDDDDDDDDGLKFTSLEDTDDPESMHDSRKITADSPERLTNDLNDYDLSLQRRVIFDFDPQNSPDPPYIIIDDDNGDEDDSRKQIIQQD